MTKKKNRKPLPTSHQQFPDRRKRSVRFVIVVVTFSVIAWHLFTGIGTAPFHVDEVGWVSAGSYYFQLMFVQHNFDLSKWNAPAHRTYGVMNLPLGKYLIGLAMHVALPPGEYFYSWDFSKSTRENFNLGNTPPLEVALPGRTMSAVFAFGSCVCMFLVCTLVWNWLVGVGASIILAFNSLFTLYAHRVMTDSYLIFFFLLTVVILVLIVAHWKDNFLRLFVLSGVYGIVVGLLISVKLNGVLGIVYLFGIFIYVFYMSTDRHLRTSVVYLVTFVCSVLCTGITIIMINPYFYTTSIGVLAERMTGVVRGWNQLLAFQASNFSKDGISGFSIAFLRKIGYEHLHIVFTGLSLVGIIVGVRQFFQRLIVRRFDRGIVTLVFLVVNLVAITAWISIDWDRYYLPVIISVIPFAAFGAYTIILWLLPRISRF